MTADELQRPSAARGPRPRRRGWTLVDRALTLVLLLVLGVIAVVLLRIGALVGLSADVCGSRGVACDFAVIDAGALTARFAPLGVLIVAILVAAHRLVRQRVASWVPLLGIGAVVGVVLLAGRLVESAITRT